MRLGFAVKVLGDGGLPSHDGRKWQSGPHLRWSIEAFHGIFDSLERRAIGMYRMTASLAPYQTHPEIGQRAEAKAKDLAVLRLRDQLAKRGLTPDPTVTQPAVAAA